MPSAPLSPPPLKQKINFKRALQFFGGGLVLIALAFAMPYLFMLFWLLGILALIIAWFFALAALFNTSEELEEAAIPQKLNKKTRLGYGLFFLLISGILFCIIWLLSIFGGHWNFG